MNTGCASECTTKTHLLNNSSTKKTLNKKYIKKDVDEVVEYLNIKTGARYKSNSGNTIKLISVKIGMVLSYFSVYMI
ncbi:hypothetical protein JCM1393_00460 [Clostridium carnis]